MGLPQISGQGPFGDDWYFALGAGARVILELAPFELRFSATKTLCFGRADCAWIVFSNFWKSYFPQRFCWINKRGNKDLSLAT